VILVGFRAGIIDENILNGTIILILVTCLVASFATEKASKKLILESEVPVKEVPEEVVSSESMIVPVANFSNLEGILEFTHFIRDRRSFEPVRILSVVDHASETEAKLAQVRKEIDKAVVNLALTDTAVLPVVTEDQNIAAGINRISREFEVTTIILGWPTRETFSDRIFGQKKDHILNNSEKTILVCRLLKPLNTYKRVVLFAPPFSEMEQGFDYLVMKIVALSSELNLPIHLYSDSKTAEAFSRTIERIPKKPVLRNFEIRNWEEFTLLLKKFSEDDLAVIFSTRKGSVSYHPQMDHLFDRFNTVCPNQSVIFTYPMANLGNDKYDKYRDFYAEPLTRSMETFRNIQRGMEKMIHKAE
jgi:hypothetical protein